MPGCTCWVMREIAEVGHGIRARRSTRGEESGRRSSDVPRAELLQGRSRSNAGAVSVVERGEQSAVQLGEIVVLRIAPVRRVRWHRRLLRSNSISSLSCAGRRSCPAGETRPGTRASSCRPKWTEVRVGRSPLRRRRSCSGSPVIDSSSQPRTCQAAYSLYAASTPTPPSPARSPRSPYAARRFAARAVPSRTRRASGDPRYG